MNDLYQAVRNGGLDPSECELLADSGKVTITHLTSAQRTDATIMEGWYASNNEEDSGRYFVEYYIDGSAIYDETITLWTDALAHVTQWARQVIHGATPDLWEESRLRRQLVEVRGDTLENTPFNDGERAEIAAELKAIKDELREQGTLSAEQLAQIEGKLDEAEEASRRLGRRDWLNAFIGITAALMIASTVTPDVANHILLTVLHALAQLFGNPPPILPG